MVEAMAGVRKGHMQDAVDSVDRPLDEDAIERLRDLGYID